MTFIDSSFTPSGSTLRTVKVVRVGWNWDTACDLWYCFWSVHSLDYKLRPWLVQTGACCYLWCLLCLRSVLCDVPFRRRSEGNLQYQPLFIKGIPALVHWLELYGAVLQCLFPLGGVVSDHFIKAKTLKCTWIFWRGKRYLLVWCTVRGLNHCLTHSSRMISCDEIFGWT